MKLWQVERSQSSDPGLRMAADRQKDEFPVAFHAGQIRQCRIIGVQKSGDPSQELDVVRPFNNHQHTHLWRIFGNRLW